MWSGTGARLAETLNLLADHEGPQRLLKQINSYQYPPTLEAFSPEDERLTAEIETREAILNPPPAPVMEAS